MIKRNKTLSKETSTALVGGETQTLEFKRTDIPISSRRPHSTPKGRYLLRDGIITRGLEQNELLLIFLEQEQSKFLSNFEAATQSIYARLESLNKDIHNNASQIADELFWTAEDIKSELSDVQAAVESQQASLGEHEKLYFDTFEKNFSNIETLSEYNFRLLVDSASKQRLQKTKALYVINSIGWVGLLSQKITKAEFQKQYKRSWDEFIELSYRHRNFKNCIEISYEEFRMIAAEYFPPTI